MPFIELETLSGPGRFHYRLSTPTETHAKAIVPDIPTVILIHPAYIGAHIFHPVFVDAKLRRFNLLALDCRGHGRTSASADDTYGPETGA
ncbi:hypothetical protein DFH07DRAFT_747833 [Mycena maculata]|uniref:Uncharacterized protein n=1 Tax=Mycena maculata TaxID=230809 RepID=A0AAD7IR45_9AGAR|nr:hypothetical protein DFH07DRAFT_747833 [Mycena maculata]